MSQCELPTAGRVASGKDFPDPPEDLPVTEGTHELVLGGGCFWCVEAVFGQLDGVEAVESGYAGGKAEQADYHTVCSGRTDHAEVIRIRYQPQRISFGQLLKVFFCSAHDPTQLDRQGNDVGRQYRSVIFYQDEPQRRVADAYIKALNQSGVFARALATRLEPLRQFYPAEAYHQDYAARNPSQPYIAMVSMPKVEKTRALFADALKKS